MQDRHCQIDENLLHRTAGPYIRVTCCRAPVAPSPLLPESDHCSARIHDMTGSSAIGGQLGEPQQFHERRIWPASPTTERQDERFNRRIGMTVERAQINLADLLAGWTEERQPQIQCGVTKLPVRTSPF